MLEFERIDSKLVYNANRVSVFNEKLKTPAGDIVNYDLVKNRNGAGMLLIDDEGMLILVKQYRLSVDDINIEIAAGCRENESEDYMKCAIREAEEETGYIPQEVFFVNDMIAAVGVLQERTSIYIGKKLIKGKINRDREEFIEIIKMSLEEAVSAIYEQKICDSKTVIAILAYKDMLGRGIIK